MSGGRIMGCLKLYKGEYKGKIIQMSEKKKKSERTKSRTKDINNESEHEPENSDKNGKEEAENRTFRISKSNIKLLNFFGAGIFAIVAWIGYEVYNFKGIITENRTNITYLMDDGEQVRKIENIEEELEKINNCLFGTGENGGSGIYSRLVSIEKLLNISKVYASSNMAASAERIQENDVSVSASSSPEFRPGESIGVDDDGNDIIAKDRVNKTMFVVYAEDNQEIYFLGQYNENYRWNGYCVTNAYNPDGTLWGICESNFDNGNRIDYKSFYRSSKKNEWIYVTNPSTEENNTRTSIRYNLEYNKVKNFTNTNSRTTDVLYIDEFIQTAEPVMLSYYCGRISEGTYNDQTGNAYEAIYNDDGTIRTLYVGNFKNGTFADDNAWDIAYYSNGDFYVYNTGAFANGKAMNKSNTPLSMDDINKIISKYDFDCELKWKSSAFNKGREN